MNSLLLFGYSCRKDCPTSYCEKNGECKLGDLLDEICNEPDAWYIKLLGNFSSLIGYVVLACFCSGIGWCYKHFCKKHDDHDKNEKEHRSGDEDSCSTNSEEVDNLHVANNFEL